MMRTNRLRALFLAASAVAAVLPALTSARAQDFPAARVIAAASGDWNMDGRTDLALLAAPAEDNGDDARLYIYLMDDNHELLRTVSAGAYAVWGNNSLDGTFGSDPALTALPNGSLAVETENSGIGRNRWQQTVTIARRDGAFIVAGFTLNWYDTLDLESADANGSCDYNVLSGKFVKNDKTDRTDARTIHLEDWDDSIGREVCGAD